MLDDLLKLIEHCAQEAVAEYKEKNFPKENESLASLFTSKETKESWEIYNAVLAEYIKRQKWKKFWINTSN